MDRFVIKTKRPPKPKREEKPPKRFKQATIGDLKKVTSLKKVKMLIDQLKDERTKIPKLSEALKSLHELHISVEILLQTKIGAVVNGIKKRIRENVEIQTQCKELVHKWKNIYRCNKVRQDRKAKKEAASFEFDIGDSRRDRALVSICRALAPNGVPQFKSRAKSDIIPLGLSESSCESSSGNSGCKPSESCSGCERVQLRDIQKAGDQTKKNETSTSLNHLLLPDGSMSKNDSFKGEKCSLPSVPSRMPRSSCHPPQKQVRSKTKNDALQHMSDATYKQFEYKYRCYVRAATLGLEKSILDRCKGDSRDPAYFGEVRELLWCLRTFSRLRRRIARGDMTPEVAESSLREAVAKYRRESRT
mmetsp:Transcript_8787/g.12085  ORF Transcript_8787/g.12085 Transcript_8787/m.12085 type:complete len:361 (+) Transcript_8787:123-1205(+)